MTAILQSLEEAVTMPKDGKEQETLIKEAIQAWLDDKFKEFNKWAVTWALKSAAAALFGWIMYQVLTSKGWTPPAH